MNVSFTENYKVKTGTLILFAIMVGAILYFVAYNDTAADSILEQCLCRLWPYAGTSMTAND